MLEWVIVIPLTILPPPQVIYSTLPGQTFLPATFYPITGFHLPTRIAPYYS